MGGNIVYAVDNGGKVHPCHHYDAENMLQIPEIHRHRGNYQTEAQTQKILYDEHQGQPQYCKQTHSHPRYDKHQKYYYKAQQHIDKAACYIGKRNHLTGKIYLRYQVLVAHNGVAAPCN